MFGVVFVFLPGIVRAGFIDDIGAAFGFDTGLLGGILGLLIIVLVVAFLAMMKTGGTAITLIVVMIAAINVVLGLWPTWVVILLAVVGGALAWNGIASGGGSGAEGE